MLRLTQISVGTEDAERNRQIETCTFFANVGRRQVNRGLMEREEERAVVNGRANSLARFSHGQVGQADDYDG